MAWTIRSTGEDPLLVNPPFPQVPHYGQQYLAAFRFVFKQLCRKELGNILYGPIGFFKKFCVFKQVLCRITINSVHFFMAVPPLSPHCFPVTFCMSHNTLLHFHQRAAIAWTEGLGILLSYNWHIGVSPEQAIGDRIMPSNSKREQRWQHSLHQIFTWR